MSSRRGAAARGRGRGVLQRALGILRRVAGMPDYAAHLEHLRRRHPDRPAPSEREFFEQYLRTRYGDGPTRCC
jgi:uncharacterized short protein YbdD (DUF466 family)